MKLYPIESFGCFIALSDKKELIHYPMHKEGGLDLEEGGEVQLVTPKFLKAANALLKTDFKLEDFEQWENDQPE